MLLLDGDDASSDGVLGVHDEGGNSLAGGDYAKALRVLPGDFDGDGRVTIHDVMGVRNAMPAFGGTTRSGRTWTAMATSTPRTSSLCSGASDCAWPERSVPVPVRKERTPGDRGPVFGGRCSWCRGRSIIKGPEVIVSSRRRGLGRGPPTGGRASSIPESQHGDLL